jgi:hypothetical protein
MTECQSIITGGMIQSKMDGSSKEFLTPLAEFDLKNG